MNNNFKNKDQDVIPKPFWKKFANPVPGWPHPYKEERNVSQSASTTSFQTFQKSMNDAWDLVDDPPSQASQTDSSKKICINKNKQTSDLLPEDTKDRLSCGKDITDKLPLKNAITKKQSEKYFKSQSRIHCIQPTIFSLITNKSDYEFGRKRTTKFQAILESSFVNINDLQQLSWAGVPTEFRPVTWRLLAGYSPVVSERRPQMLDRKRRDYWNLVKQHYHTRSKDKKFQHIYQQIHIDIPRMSPMLSLFQEKVVQEMFERILFIWAIRHPATGYVQGMNDLVTPFFVVFLLEELMSDDIETLQVSSLPKDKLECIEADSFWCFSPFIDNVQDNYVFAQLGIQQKVNHLIELTQRIDRTLHNHLENQGISYIQFSFRWMNNLLTRELPLWCTIRLWDTYLAEADFASLHVYVCAAFLQHWRQQLLTENDFQGLMIMLQNLPTQNWKAKQIEMLLADAYRLKYMFDDAPNHLQNP